MLTVVATVLLLLHMTLANRLADVASEIAVSGSYLRGPRLQIMADAAAAVLLLVVSTVLSVYKPRGMTLYGIRKQHQEHRMAGQEIAGALELEKSASVPLWVRVFGIAALVILVLFRVILVHVSGGGGHHFH